MRIHGIDAGIAQLELGVVVRADADVDAGRGLVDREGIDARVLQRLPAHFKQQSLLRIDARSLAWGDAEVLRIEAIDALEQSRPAGGLGQLPAMKQASEALFNIFGNSGFLFAEQLPIGLQAILGAIFRGGNPATGTDDRDRLRSLPLQLLHTHLRSLQSEEGLLERRESPIWHAAFHHRLLNRWFKSCSTSSSDISLNCWAVTGAGFEAGIFKPRAAPLPV